jgi:hypothetical protein
MYNNSSVYYPYPLYGEPVPCKKVKKKCTPGALTYYEGYCYKPAPQMYDPANWVIQPPIKKEVKKVSCKPSCVSSHEYFIDLNFKKY